MGPISCTETSVRKYHYSLFNNPEERSFHLLCGESLKSRTSGVLFASGLNIFKMYLYFHNDEARDYKIISMKS